MTMWWSLAGGLAGLAIWAGVADRQRRVRADPDRVGLIDWAGVQLFSTATAIVVISVALHA